MGFMLDSSPVADHGEGCTWTKSGTPTTKKKQAKGRNAPRQKHLVKFPSTHAIYTLADRAREYYTALTERMRTALGSAPGHRAEHGSHSVGHLAAVSLWNTELRSGSTADG